MKADGIAWPQALESLEKVWSEQFSTPEPTSEPAPEPAPLVCGMELDEYGNTIWQACQSHTGLVMNVVMTLPPTATAQEMASAYSVAWQIELDRLYQTWLMNGEDPQQVNSHRAAFMAELNSLLQQTDEDAAILQERANALLMQQCFTLCPPCHGSKIK